MTTCLTTWQHTSPKKDAVLQGASLSAYRRLIVQLRWPAHLVMPEFLYVTSAMAQKVTSACVADLVEGNKVLKTMKEAAKSGGAPITIRPLHGDVMFVSYFDASLGSSGGHAQQGEVHLMTTADVFSKPTSANMLEFHSNKISRVVRSSLAAEGSAMASAGTGCCTIELCTTPYALVCWSLTRNGTITYAPLDAL